MCPSFVGTCIPVVRQGILAPSLFFHDTKRFGFGWLFLSPSTEVSSWTVAGKLGGVELACV